MKRIYRIATFAAVVFTATAITLSAGTRSFAVQVSGSGEPMILIPGLESSGAVWNGIVAQFQSHYQLHVLTISGFAGQPPVPGLQLRTVRDDVISYIREQHLNRPVIVGHSLGGFLAVWIAAAAPDLPARVISVDGVPFLPSLLNPAATVESSKAVAEQMRSMYAHMKPEEFAAAGRAALGMMISDKKNLDVAAAWAAQSDPAFVAQAVYDLFNTDLREEVRKIQTPVLLIGAAKPFAGDPERLQKARAAYEQQVAAIPDHKVVMATNALHFIMFDDAQFLVSAMQNFLEGGHSRGR